MQLNTNNVHVRHLARALLPLGSNCSTVLNNLRSDRELCEVIILSNCHRWTWMPMIFIHKARESLTENFVKSWRRKIWF